MTKPYFARLAWGSALALLLASGLTLSGCLHSGDDPAPATEMPGDGDMTEMPEEPSAYEAGLDAINGATSAAAAQAAYDAVDQTAITGAEDMALRDALADALAVFAAADEAADEARMAANEVAGTMGTAIATEGDPNTTAERPFDLATAPSDPTAPTGAENYVLTVKHTGTGVEAMVLDGALNADNDPAFETVSTFPGGLLLVRNIGTERQIIAVNTDIEAPDDVAFSSRHMLTVDRDTDTTANDTYAVLEADNERIASSNFPAGVTTSKTYVQYDADTTTGRASQFAGTFDGAAGTYRCVASGGCTVSTDAMGDFSALNVGEWEFTPNAGVTVKLPDQDYLTYGVWIGTTTKDGAIVSYDTVQTYAMSSLDVSTNLSSVTGTATYEGRAAGVYSHETTKADGTLDMASAGGFAADVALTAYFDAVIPYGADTIQGTVSNFVLEGGIANEWEVGLAADSIATDAGFTGTASGGVTGEPGSLSGRFHGAGDADTDAPPVLVGEFNSVFTNGSVAGAFGARIDDE